MELKTFIKQHYGVTLTSENLGTLERIIISNKTERANAKLERLAGYIACYFGVSLTQNSRKRIYIDAREIFVAKARKMGYGLREIGNIIGRHYSTVLHYEKLHKADIQFSTSYKEKYEDVTLFIRSMDPKI